MEFVVNPSPGTSVLKLLRTEQRKLGILDVPRSF